MIVFGDSSRPAEIPFAYAALYSGDCEYPCPPGAASRWPVSNRRWISQAGAPECSILDFEQYTKIFAKPVRVKDWLITREGDREKYPREEWIYSDLDNAAAAYEQAEGQSFLWWVATLDGIRHSRQELANMLNDHGVPARAADVAAEQWKDTGAYDVSQLFATW